MFHLIAQASKELTAAADKTVDAANQAAGKTDSNGASDLIKTATTWITENGLAFVVSLVTAILIFVIGKMVAKAVSNGVQKMMAKSKVDETLTKFVGTIVYSILLILVIISAVGQLGVKTGGFTAILAAAGFAIGMALSGTLSNFASGVMIILFRPFKAGDFIDAGGATGVVEEVHLFNTIMKTGDHVQIIVPNSSILGGKITNFSAKSTRRIDLTFGCAYEDNLKAVKSYLEEVIANHPKVLKDPGATIAVAELGASSVDFIVRPWVSSADYWAVRFDLIETIKLGFDEKGFNFPYQTQTVYVEKNEA